MFTETVPFAIVSGEEFAGPQDLCLAYRSLKAKHAELLAIAEAAEDLRADAMRWRGARASRELDIDVGVSVPGQYLWLQGDEADAAIDAALSTVAPVREGP